jgi:hypothetical protein
MAQVVGRIAVVQESRFRVITVMGQSYLLTLDRNANVAAADLGRYQRHNCAVIVTYTGQPGLASAVAHSIRPRT